MLRSPIFLILSCLLIISCQQNAAISTTETKPQETQQHQLAIKYSEIADSLNHSKKFERALVYYSKSKEIFETEKDTAYITYNLIQIARIQQTFGDYTGSEETLTESLPFINVDQNYLLAAKNLLGIAAKELNNYSDALNYYQQVLDKTANNVLKTAMLNNMATVAMEQKQYKKAIKILEPISKLTILDTLPSQKARILDNLGFAYFKNNQLDRGFVLLNNALSLRINNGDSYGSIESYLHLADFYKNKKSNQAIIYAKKAYALATQHQSVDDRLEALQFLFSQNENTGSNGYASQFITLNDSIKKVRNNAKNQFAKIKYDSRKANVENMQMKTQRAETLLLLETEKNQKYLLYIALVGVLLSIVALVNHYKNKNQRERIQATYSTETRISKKLHDELANDVFYAMTFAETQDLQNPEKKETLLNNLDLIYARTRNISKENSPIDIGENYEYQLKQMLTNYKSSTTEVIIKNGNSINWSTTTPEKKIAVQRVLQEFMVNMKKYSQASFVIIGFDLVQNTIKINYSDNGVGFKEKLILKNGLQNVENRIHAVSGIVTFESEPNKGFRATISLPN
jgi:signal transduction histidine kinase/predicted negative regulator of RcsB-dependent stress response